MTEAIISSIQRFSINDGPGIRTTVFMKGCPLRCLWCQNPESNSSKPEIMCYTQEARCHYEKCRSEAPWVLEKLRIGEYARVEGLGADCRAVVESYCAGDLEFVGEEKSPEEVMQEIRRDKAFFRESSGGVTVSGGEPLAQVPFLAALLQECREEGIHTAIDTCGHVEWRNVENVLPYANLFLFDLKHMDSQKHREYTGVSNDLILENFRRIAAADVGLTASIPVIPGLNDDDENARKVGKFLGGLSPGLSVRLLPYHRFSMSKYKALGLPYVMPEIPEDQIRKSVRRFREMLGRFGLRIED